MSTLSLDAMDDELTYCVGSSERQMWTQRR